MNCFDTIKNVYYINLETRPDRKEHAENELRSLGWNPKRFNAIKLSNGALGCSTSHLRCLELAKSEDLEHILICEDDITFLNKDLFKNQLNNFLSANKSWDVILIAGNNMGSIIPISNSAVKVSNCNAATGYLVKNTYFDTLIQNFQEGINKLTAEPHKHQLYAIDQYWSKLQQKDNWILIIPLTVTQKEGHSDIEKTHTNYNYLMLSIHKKHGNIVKPQINNNNNKFKSMKFI